MAAPITAALIDHAVRARIRKNAPHLFDLK